MSDRYATIVVDPPWPIAKIRREVRPNQVEMDYSLMTLGEIAALPVGDLALPDAHLYLWTTQKRLPDALDCASGWGFRYQCLLTWVKNVGFTPFSWMYSTEHVVFARRGSPPMLRLGLRLDFAAKVREHSRKPDIFYDRVRLASPGPRLEMFARERREGFDAWGDEVDKFAKEGP
jgi:N6-adenosine-specific RNA methylase IME4